MSDAKVIAAADDYAAIRVREAELQAEKESLRQMADLKARLESMGVDAAKPDTDRSGFFAPDPPKKIEGRGTQELVERKLLVPTDAKGNPDLSKAREDGPDQAYARIRRALTFDGAVVELWTDDRMPRRLDVNCGESQVMMYHKQGPDETNIERLGELIGSTIAMAVKDTDPTSVPAWIESRLPQIVERAITNHPNWKMLGHRRINGDGLVVLEPAAFEVGVTAHGGGGGGGSGVFDKLVAEGQQAFNDFMNGKREPLYVQRVNYNRAVQIDDRKGNGAVVELGRLPKDREIEALSVAIENLRSHYPDWSVPLLVEAAVDCTEWYIVDRSDSGRSQTGRFHEAAKAIPCDVCGCTELVNTIEGHLACADCKSILIPAAKPPRKPKPGKPRPPYNEPQLDPLLADLSPVDKLEIWLKQTALRMAIEATPTDIVGYLEAVSVKFDAFHQMLMFGRSSGPSLQQRDAAEARIKAAMELGAMPSLADLLLCSSKV